MKLDYFFNSDTINLTKVIVKTILQKMYISNKCISFELTIHQKILENNASRIPQKYEVELFSTLIMIRNYSWATSPHVRMISEGSCDTEDWSNDAENSALHRKNKLYFIIYSNKKQTVILNCNNISQNYCFYCIILLYYFTVLNAALVSVSDLIFQKHYKPQTLNSNVFWHNWYLCTMRFFHFVQS